MIQKLQRFGGAMMAPVMLMPFAGIIIGFSSIFTNADIMGSLAESTTVWYQFWSMIYDGGYAIFNQLPLLYVISLPIGLANKQSGRAAMESFVIYITFNYFIQAMLTNWGATLFNVDFTQEVGGMSGLTTIAGIKTIDMSVVGAIMIAGIAVALHNKYYEVKLPSLLNSFQGSAFIIILGFVLMIPVAALVCFIWPIVQQGILGLQGFLASSGNIGVFLFTFFEKLTMPTGLHHFLWVPFDLGPAVISDGNWTHWLANVNEYAKSTASLKSLFPTGGYALYGNCAVFGLPGAALAMYKTAKPENKKTVATALIAATIPAVLCGITEPIEFSFLFVAPLLFVVHCFLGGLLSMVLYIFGVVGYQGGGLIDYITYNWMPMFQNHSAEVITHIVIGLSFTVIYFFVFYFLIKKFDFKTLGREDETTSTEGSAVSGGNEKFKEMAIGILEELGGKDNIVSATNCMTRLRVTVNDENLVSSDDEDFKKYNAYGVVRNGKAFQVIIGFDVENVKSEFDKLL